MQRMVLKQVLFLFLLAAALVLVMGVLFITNAQAQTAFRFLPDWDWDWDEDWDIGGRVSPQIRYNRVEGVYTGFQVNKAYWRRRYPRRAFLFGFTGYAFHAKELEFQAGLEKGFMRETRLSVGGEYHRMIDTPDRWILPEEENSLAAFLIEEDYYDYFLREGASGYIQQNVGRTFEFSVGYHYDHWDSLDMNVSWSLLGGKKRFAPNPPMDAGDLYSVVGKFVMDTRNSDRRTTRGWYIQAEGEYAGKELGGDFEFSRIVVDARRYQPLGFGEGVDIRVRAGTSHGHLPWQRSFHLGGLSTLRGYPFKAYPDGRQSPGANRMLLAQVEYRMGESNFPDEIGLWFFDMFNLILFYDCGWITSVDPETDIFGGFEDLVETRFRQDVGMALANRSGSVRFEVARRLEGRKKPFTFMFRISRPF